MSDNIPTAAQTPVTLTEETKLLLNIASGVPVLCRLMGLIKSAGSQPGRVRVGLVGMQRSWLGEHPIRGAAEKTFDPDKFAKRLDVVSTGERHAMLWLLNVWNPTYAKSKGWTFDLFAALSSLDSENSFGIAEWVANPRWP
jgi:hypothetical protein